MSDRVGVDKAVIGVRLEVEELGTRCQDARPRRVEVIDEEVEVHLHGRVALGPPRRAEVVDLLDPQ